MFSLRRDIPDLTGHDDDLGVLLDAVEAAADGPTRAIAIHAVIGMPGVGKTVFGAHAAHRAAHRFPDGHLFLDLYGQNPSAHPRSTRLTRCQWPPASTRKPSHATSTNG